MLSFAYWGLHEWSSWDKDYRATVDGLASAIIGAFVGSVAVLFAGFVAYIQLSGLRDTASADFVLRKSEQFFTDQTRILLELTAAKFLEYNHSDDFTFGYFMVNKKFVQQAPLEESLKERLLERRAFSQSEIDDFLGHLEELGYLLKRGIVDLGLLDNSFGYHIDMIMDCPAIRQYIARSRREDDPNSWENLIELHKRVVRFWGKEVDESDWED
jgi:hypothetical protein